MGAWSKAKKLIDKSLKQTNLVYSYAYGSLSANNPNMVKNISSFLDKDKNGILYLICGAYFEQNGDMHKGYNFYKTAYKKNPINFYNIFAYARALDLMGDYKMAIKIYQKALLSSKNKKNVQDIENRIQQLRSNLR
jgi:tetratricopeptide (TPR) repeat protein